MLLCTCQVILGGVGGLHTPSPPQAPIDPTPSHHEALVDPMAHWHPYSYIGLFINLVL